MLLPVLAVLLLGTSGCVAAALVGAAGAGAGLGYSQSKKNQTSTSQTSTKATAPSDSTAPRSSSVRLAPAPAELVECKLQDGETFAMSAADCKAKGGSVS
jgi:hypothetical protein